MGLKNDNAKAQLRQFRRNYGSRYVVVPRLGDPLFQPARARGIWAAHHASGVASCGLNPLLIVGRSNFPFSLETRGRESSADRILKDFYGIAEPIDVAVLNEIDRTRLDVPMAQESAIIEFSQKTTAARFCHLRDPLVARWCSMHGPSFVYEDHGEDYHDMARPTMAGILNSPACRLVIAVTDTICDLLIENGVQPRKIKVLGSAAALQASQHDNSQIEKCRAFHLRGGHEKLITYAGGLQPERGIEHIISAAKNFPRFKFILIGGNDADREIWTNNTALEIPENIFWAGYLPLPDAVLIESASDALLVTRDDSDRQKISSPLKLYEYLSTGVPIISYMDLARTNRSDSTIALATYKPAEPESLTESLKELVERFPRLPSGYQGNVNASLEHTWQARAMKVIEAVNDQDENWAVENG